MKSGGIFEEINLLENCKIVDFMNMLSIETIIEISTVEFMKNYCLINVHRRPSDNSVELVLFFTCYINYLVEM